MPPDLKRVTLPDGTPFWCLRPGEVRLIQDSVRDYFRHGIVVEDGDIVFDVGANIGLFAHAVRQLAADVSVFSFEPIPAVFAALQENARTCDDGRWLAINCALGQSMGTSTFRYHHRASMMSTAYPDSSLAERRQWRETVLGNLARYPWTIRWLGWLPRFISEPLLDVGIRRALRGQRVTCAVRTVSDVIREYGLPRIDLLKVDVERGEIDVLAGIEADDWLRIRQVAVEVHDLDSGRVGGVAALLRRHGFDVVIDQEVMLRATDIFNLYGVRGGGMFKRLRDHTIDRVAGHRARWTARRVGPLIRPNDRVLDVGAGDCRLDLLLHRQVGCEVVPVDVADFNRTELPLVRYDGLHLPFPDDSFDVVLLVFVLHHSVDPRAVLAEATRVSRRQVLVLEDVNSSWWDRLVFRPFHRWAEWSQKMPRPYHEWSPDRWRRLAGEVGLHERWSRLVGRQLGHLASRHILFDWQKQSIDEIPSLPRLGSALRAVHRVEADRPLAGR